MTVCQMTIQRPGEALTVPAVPLGGDSVWLSSVYVSPERALGPLDPRTSGL